MTIFFRAATLSGILLVLSSQALSNPVIEAVSSTGADPSKSVLIITRLSDSQTWISNADRVDHPYPPASTSKIPHTLIALETGIAKPTTKFAWDGKKRFANSWNQDQTLATAFSRSAVWVYQQITSSLGSDTMAQWLNEFGYGNGIVGGPKDLTTYWLRGPLEISARQQTEFLEDLANQTLPLSPATYRRAKDIMLAKSGQNWRLYGKSGWRHDGKNQDIGWYVGWLETGTSEYPGIYVFAFNMDMNGPEDLDKRINSVMNGLKAVGAIAE